MAGGGCRQGAYSRGRGVATVARTILVVEDDRKTADLISRYLQHDHYQVLLAGTGREALELARRRRPDLVVLDLMLPQMHGLDVCRVLRTESAIPIIMLTAKTTEEDKLLGLNLGADDYVVKPFSPRELVARVRVLLRRLAPDGEPSPAICAGNLTVDFARHQVLVDEEVVHLTPKEFNLLGVLVRSPGRVFTRAQLVDRVFGADYEGGERTVDVHLMNVRKKIERNPERPQYLRTVFGVGYKFEAGDAHP